MFLRAQNLICMKLFELQGQLQKGEVGTSSTSVSLHWEILVPLIAAKSSLPRSRALGGDAILARHHPT
jgi:hypothetical protein